ncbi:MAG: PKD domain-containing protein [Chloroflexi bacterium]|nr:PKD domain-containing protein [Chloroflexota bacterium]
MHRRGFIIGLILFCTLILTSMLTHSTAQVGQLPNPLVIVSNHGQAGPTVDKTLVHNTFTDPVPDWNGRFFNPVGWPDAYPVMRALAWTTSPDVAPLLAAGADHIWGGTPSGPLTADAGNGTTYANRFATGNYDNGYPIPTGSQYLFLRRDFCLPINAQASLATRRLSTGGTSITLLNATGVITDGAASVWLNGTTIAVVSDDESGNTTDINVPDPSFLFRGHNALALRTGDARSDERAAILYRAAFSYALDPNAITTTINTTPSFEQEQVQFYVTTDGLSGRTPFNYAWTFGDGGGAAGTTVYHTYTTTGDYTATLSIADIDSCTATLEMPVTVLPFPLSITKTATPDPVTAGESLHYQITVQNTSTVRDLTGVVVADELPLETTFAFCSNGCTPPTPPARVVSWSLGTLGTESTIILDLYMTVALTASGRLTNTTYGVQTNEVYTTGVPVGVEVLPAPCLLALTNLDVTGSDNGLINTSYPFTGTIAPPNASEPIYYTWTPTPVNGQGTSTADYQWVTPGWYTLTLRAENCAPPDTVAVTATHVISINSPCPSPVTGASISGPTSAYTDTTYSFSANLTPTNATQPVTYTWSPLPLSGQSTPTSTYEWSTPGWYTLTLTVENCGGTVTTTHVISVNVPCPHPLTGARISGPGNGFTDTLYTFSGIITPANATEPVTYTWSPTPSSGQGTLTTTYQWATPGWYTLTLRAENCGGIVTATHIISVSAPPITCPFPLTGVNITGPTNGIIDTPYLFGNVPTPNYLTHPITYTWSPPPLSGQGTPTTTYQWATPGWHTLTLTAENCGGAVTTTHAISISTSITCSHPLLGVSINGPTSGYTNTQYSLTAALNPANATTPVTYTWSPAPLSGQGTPSAVYQWAITGTRTISLTAENCGGIFNDAHTITIGVRRPSFVYLPVLVRNYPDDAPDACPGWSLAIAEPFDEDFDHTADQDWFTFQATADVSYTIRTLDLEIRADTVITIYDSTCTTPLATNDDLPPPSNSRASQIGWRATATGPLHVLVRQFDPASFDTDTGYSLAVYDEANPAPRIDDAPDFCSLAADLATGQPYTNDFDHANDNDWFVFDATAGHTYTIATGNLGTRADTVLELWDDDCALRLSIDVEPGNPEAQIIWPATFSDQLRVNVRHYDWTIYGPDTDYSVTVGEE